MAWSLPRGARLRSQSLIVTRVVVVFLMAGLLIASTGPALAEQAEPTEVRVRGAAGLDPNSIPEAQTTQGDADEAAWQQVQASEMPSPEPPPAPTPEPTPEPPPAPPVGDQIVAFAMQYQGYPYVWAGNTAAGFDCSGFTQFVILNTLGTDIGHGIDGQPGAGAWIDYGAWLPGDLIFFQNTYRAGLSHVGLYIGDGLFIHAENEGTGVVVSSLYSDYYGPRYWGAVRVA